MEEVGFPEPTAGEHFAESRQSHDSSPKTEHISLTQELHILHLKPEVCMLHSNSTKEQGGQILLTLQMKKPSPRKGEKKFKACLSHSATK